MQADLLDQKIRFWTELTCTGIPGTLVILIETCNFVACDYYKLIFVLWQPFSFMPFVVRQFTFKRIPYVSHIPPSL